MLSHFARCAGLVLGLSIAAPSAAFAACVPGDGKAIEKVCYEPTDGVVYGHGILGNTPEWAELVVYWGPEQAQRQTSAISAENHIYEDVAPRFIDITGDGRAEIVAVQSSFTQGARLVVYSLEAGLNQLATTPYIGTRNRWLAPIGAADLDGDGHLEIAYIDRPHLAKTLRVWRYKDGKLKEIATVAGLTNHRIGEDYISGGLRDCGDGPEMITASANWSRLMATRLVDGKLEIRDIGRHKGPKSFERALACR